MAILAPRAAAFVLAALGMAGPLLAQRPVIINGVKQLDTGMQVCDQESEFEVWLREGLIPILEIQVILKPAPDSLSPEIPLRIELVDVSGRLVELADSTAGTVAEEPPWVRVQSQGEGRHLLELLNRRPKADNRFSRRFKIRVSLDSVKNSAKETRPFWLYWPELGQQFCKHVP